MIENIRVSILGCGWMGYPLAKELLTKGYSVKGSTTSPDKLSLMRQDRIDPFLVQFDPDIVTDREGFFDSDLLIIAIPPKNNPEKYLLQVQTIIRNIQGHPIKNIIYFSSTSVYGNTNKIVDEEDIAMPDTPSAKVMRSVEDVLLNHSSFKTTVIRFGGLVGPERHPGRFLAGKTDVQNGFAPVNLIYLDDCIGIISSILENNLFGKIVNACSPDHPSRKDYYTLAAQIAGLTEPQFRDELNEWKIVNSMHIPGLLNYDFKVKDWMAWLRDQKKL
ncbi:MAG TPA: NAD(P)-dependent oxidoreductase [Sphingobacteriaceae bacterium]|nr:NAD(P)-dependent oxidoreductase [Sphingobacteriaceae bacterium]